MTATTVAAVGRRIGATDNGIAAAVSRSLRGRHDRRVDAAAAREIYRTLPAAPTPSRQSRALAAALLGEHGPALTCTCAGTARPGPRRADGRRRADRRAPRRCASRCARRSASRSLAASRRRVCSTGHIEGSAHYEGRAIDVFFRPITAANQQLGWQQAQWAVAHADALQVATIIFDRRVWSAERSASGWRDYVYPGRPHREPRAAARGPRPRRRTPRVAMRSDLFLSAGSGGAADGRDHHATRVRCTRWRAGRRTRRRHARQRR